MMPDFASMGCAGVWDYIEDPNSDPRWLPAAFNYWNTHCAEGYPGYTPQSGGGRMGGLPPHG